MAILSPTTSIYFFRGCEKSSKKSIKRKKSGCHPWKNGHLTPKMMKLGLNNSWWANVLIREVKKRPRLVPKMLWDDTRLLKKLKTMPEINLNWPEMISKWLQLVQIHTEWFKLVPDGPNTIVCCSHPYFNYWIQSFQ